MSIIRASVTDQRLKITEAPVIASGGQNETSIVFTFCEKWDGFVKTAIFYRDEEEVYHCVLDAENTCVVPWEVCYESGTFYIGVFGDKDGIRRTSTVARYKVKKGAITEDTKPSDPTPDVYDQIMAMLGNTHGGGLTTTAAALLLAILKDCYTGSNQDANIQALESELMKNSSGGGNTGGNGGESEEPDVPVVPDEPEEPVITLTSISAVVNEDTVAVGTAAADLDITVTAHYSDGTTAVVTDYSISGTVAEGENTFTIVYSGKTTTVKVTGTHLPIYSLYDTEKTDNTQIDTGVNPFGVDQSVAIFVDVTSITPNLNQTVFISRVSKTNAATTSAVLRSGGKATAVANGTAMGNVFGGGSTTAGDNVKAVLTRQAGSTTFDVYWYQHRATSNGDFWTKKTGFEVGAWNPTEDTLKVVGGGLKFNSFEVYTNKYVTEAEALEFTGGTAFTEV